MMPETVQGESMVSPAVKAPEDDKNLDIKKDEAAQKPEQAAAVMD